MEWSGFSVWPEMPNMSSNAETRDWREGSGRSGEAFGSPSLENSELVRILDLYLADLQAGRAPERAQVIADHPELADQLESCLAGIDFIHRTTGRTKPGEQPVVTLGEFLIVREIGRGGMGVVYEAEQTSLRRRVALKVLRFGVVADEGTMQRFGREAETVARMHHTNIVPIFGVGHDQGVHYYAMQFIEGRNLADVLLESQQSEKPISPEDVASWGLQAAEALEYAHRRGVIHRDVKPSNLMLDREGIVWLTDFGLAKRVDEATLTVAGTLMGTPRYMSPEQAEALHHPVDHRTDIYSLGATLYELATGRPVFESSTPIGVIRHILSDEPVPPRQIRPGLSRDLETVLLTCLAKNPARRHASAQALADDLRAVLDSRPIQARRVGPLEKATRWVRQQKRMVAVAGVAAVATVLLVGSLGLGWYAYSRSRLADLRLTTNDPHLAAEIVDSNTDDQVVPGVSLPTRQPLELPAGEYRVRLSAPDQLTESYDLRLPQGKSRSFDVHLGHETLFDPIETGPFLTLKRIEENGKTDLVQLQSQQIRRLDGATGNVVWEFDPSARLHDPKINGTLVPDTSRADHDRQIQGFNLIRANGMNQSPGLVKPLPDLDGDGSGDLVWAGRSGPILWAFSGQGDDRGQGRELWMYQAERGGWVVGEPAVQDVDADGTPDLIAMFQMNDQVRVEAVSGRSGSMLWRFEPEANSSLDSGSIPTQPVQVGRLGGMDRVLIGRGSGLATLDPSTGKIDREFTLENPLVREPKLADLDGDGLLDLLVLEQEDTGLRLVALTGAERSELWSRPVQADRPAHGSSDPEPDWPLVVDLDHDGACEVIVPSLASVGAIHSTSVEVLRGTNGSPLWSRRIRTPQTPTGVDRLLEGPDLDGDGWSELFVAMIAKEPGPAFQPDASLYVDAISGRDGTPFWWWSRETSREGDRIESVRWWGPGPDGWPQLMVSLLRWPGKPASVSLLSAGTGKLVQELPEAFDPNPADFDGDGILDLGYSTTPHSNVFLNRSFSHALRGQPPVAWARLGSFEPIADLNADGLEDLVEPSDSGLTAVSGRDGTLLWESDPPSRSEKLQGQWSLMPGTEEIVGAQNTPDLQEGGDLDADGTPDLLIGLRNGYSYNSIDHKDIPIPLRILSGRTGGNLWRANTLDASDQPLHDATVALPKRACFVDLDADGATDIAAIMYLERPVSPQTYELWLYGLSGRGGGLMWKQLLANRTSASGSGSLQDLIPPFQVARLDGDSVDDFVVAVPVPVTGATFTVEIRACGGRDGRPLWTRSLGPRSLWGSDLKTSFPTLTVGDLDGDGVSEVIVVDQVPVTTGSTVLGRSGAQDFRVEILEGPTGQPRGEPWRFRDDRDPFRPLPCPSLVDLEGKGHRGIALLCRDEQNAHLVLLNERGQVHQERDYQGVRPMSWSNAVSVFDLDGDGDDELVVIIARENQSVIEVFGGDLKRPLWTRSFADAGRIVEVIPGTAEYAGSVAYGGVRDVLLGLDGETGRERWFGQGRMAENGPSVNGLSVFDGHLLHDRRPDRSPRVLGRSDSSTVCLRTLPVARPEQTDGLERQPAVLRPKSGDPRLTRPLPWSSYPDETFYVGLYIAVLALVLLAFPLWAIGWIVNRRPMRLGWLMLIPVILAVTLAMAQATRSAEAFWQPGLPLWGIFLQASMGFPLVILPVQAGLWWKRRAWRRVLILTGLIAISSVSLAAFQLHQDTSLKPPWQTYSWKGWYVILELGLYLVGVLMTAWIVLSRLSLLVWQGLKGSLRRTRPAKTGQGRT